MKKKRNKSDSLQAVLIPKSMANSREIALTKARRYGKQMIRVDEMPNYWRCRRSGTDFPTYYTRTIDKGRSKGVQLIYGSDEDG